MTKNQKIGFGSIAVLGAILYLLNKLGDILWPFIFALILAYLLNPLADRLRKRGVSKAGAIWIIFIGFFLLLMATGAFLFSIIRAEIPVVQAKIPLYVEYLQNQGIPWLENLFHIKFQKTTQEYIKGVTERLLTLSPGMAESISNFAAQIFSRTLTVLLLFIDLLLVPVVLLYLMFDLDKISLWIPRLVPEAYQQQFKRHLGEIDQILKRFIGGQVLISFLLFLFYMMGLAWIGIDLSVILALFTALINIVPYVGVLAGALISILFAIFKFHDLTHPLLVMALFAAGHVLDGYFLNPKIVGRQIGLHPILVMFSLILGGKLFGVIGLVFSVPAAAVINYLFNVLFGAYQKSKFYSGINSS